MDSYQHTTTLLHYNTRPTLDPCLGYFLLPRLTSLSCPDSGSSIILLPRESDLFTFPFRTSSLKIQLYLNLFNILKVRGHQLAVSMQITGNLPSS